LEKTIDVSRGVVVDEMADIAEEEVGEHYLFFYSYCPVCLFYAIVISAVFLLPFLVVRAFKEIRRRKPVYLGFLKFLAISSLWLRTKGNDRIIEKRAFRIVRTRPFCEDQKCLAIARFDYSKMRVYAPRRRALVVPAPESGKPSRGVRI
jgi:hypothetical protein